jgi:hypothetical protein
MSVRALKRFFAIGFADADAKVGRLLAPRSFSAADRYLSTSAVVRRFDAAARGLRDWWRASATAGTMLALADEWQRQDRAVQYQAVAVALLSAAGVHVLLTVINGPRPGWFWLIVPALASTLAVMILAGSRTRTPQ